MKARSLTMLGLCIGGAVLLALYSGSSKGADSVAAGEQIFEKNCAACHGPGPGMPPFAEKPGTEALRAKYNGTMPAVLAERTDLTPEVVTYFVRNGVSVMAPYRKTEISDAELVHLGAYLSRNNPDLRKGGKKK